MREQFELLSQIDASPGVYVTEALLLLEFPYLKLDNQSLLWEARQNCYCLMCFSLTRCILIATKLLKAVFVWLSSTEATCPEWKELEQAMTSVHSVVNGLVDFSKVGTVVLNLQLQYTPSAMYLISTNLLKHSKLLVLQNLWSGREL